MADERDVDRRKLLPCQTRGVDALRSREGDGARALRPDRIGQDVQPVHLDEDGRVVDERDAHRAAPDAVRGIGRRRDLRPLSPRTRLAGPHPLDEIPEASGPGRSLVSETAAQRDVDAERTQSGSGTFHPPPSALYSWTKFASRFKRICASAFSAGYNCCSACRTSRYPARPAT